MSRTAKLRKPRVVFSVGMHIDVEKLVSRAAKRVGMSRNAFINEAAEEQAARVFQKNGAVLAKAS